MPTFWASSHLNKDPAKSATTFSLDVSTLVGAVAASISTFPTSISFSISKRLSRMPSRTFRVGLLHLILFQRVLTCIAELDLDLIPQARPTLPSPNTYGYRTKLTPHFEAQPAKLSLPEKQERLSIGFQHKGRRTILDIEECPIATPTINEKLKSERQAVKECV